MASEYSKFWMVWRNDGNSPTCKHFTKDAAEREAERLAIKEPGAVFFVLKSVSGVQSDIPAVHRVKLINPDDIPF